MDAVALLRVGCVEVGRHPVDQESRRLQRVERLSGLRVTGEVPCQLAREVRLAGHAEQEVTLLAPQANEDLSRHKVRDGLARRLDELFRVLAGGESGTGSSGQDQGSAPALGAVDDGFEDLRPGGAGVLGGQRDALLPGQPQDVATQDREVAEKLGDEPRDRQVPTGQQDQAQAVRVGGQALVDQADTGRGEQVGVVDHNQQREAFDRGRAVEDLPEELDRGHPRGVVPDGVDVTARRGQPARHAECLSRAGGGDDDRDGLVARGLQLAPQQSPRRVVAR